MDNQAYLFYLMIQETVAATSLDQFLQKVGFELTKHTGKGLKTFRNYHYQFKTADGMVQLHFTLPPNQVTVKTVSLSLTTEDKRAIVAAVFERLQRLKTDLKFELMDAELKTKHLLTLKEGGKVNEYLIGLTTEETNNLEKLCFVELNAELFWKNEENLRKRTQFGH